MYRTLRSPGQNAREADGSAQRGRETHCSATVHVQPVQDPPIHHPSMVCSHQPLGLPPHCARVVPVSRPRGIRVRRGLPPTTTAGTSLRPPSTAGNPAAGSARTHVSRTAANTPAAYRPPAAADRSTPRVRRRSANTAESSSSISTAVWASASYRRARRCCGYSRTSRSNSRCRVPTFSAGNAPTSITRRTVGRLTPSRSAACCVVDIVACGATVTARPACNAATTCSRRHAPPPTSHPPPPAPDTCADPTPASNLSK